MSARVMLVTGGGRGIGAATALLAAERGWDLGVNYVSHREAAEKLCRQIESAGGRRAIAIGADVSQEGDVAAMFQTMEKTFGRLDALVNNAGILERQARLEDFAVDRVRRVFDVNVIGTFLCAREAVRRMSTKFGGNGGAIVNVSSRAAQIGGPNEYVDYAATKGAVESLTIGLAKEVAADGIRVNAVRPGLIHTDIHASGGEPDRIARLESGVPMQRGGAAEEVARSILFLASDESSYTTGSFVDVSGGR